MSGPDIPTPATECEHCIDVRTFGDVSVRKIPGAYCRHEAPKPPHVPDSFEKIVGVRLDEWMAADRLDSFDALLRMRDAGEGV